MSRLLNYFFQGLLYLAPLALTVWVFVTVFRFVDTLIAFPVPGVGALVLVVATTGFGFLLSRYFTRRILGFLTGLLERVPLAKLIHGAIKDLMGAFVGEHRKFDTPVAVELVPDSGVRVLGFRTRTNMEPWGLADCVGVYLPQAYNFAGQLVVVPEDRVTPIDGDSADIMKLIVSGGVSGEAELPAAGAEG